MWMIEEMKEMEELVQVGLQRFLGGGDQ